MPGAVDREKADGDAMAGFPTHRNSYCDTATPGPASRNRYGALAFPLRDSGGRPLRPGATGFPPLPTGFWREVAGDRDSPEIAKISGDLDLAQSHSSMAVTTGKGPSERAKVAEGCRRGSPNDLEGRGENLGSEVESRILILNLASLGVGSAEVRGRPEIRPEIRPPANQGVIMNFVILAVSRMRVQSGRRRTQTTSSVSRHCEVDTPP